MIEGDRGRPICLLNSRLESPYGLLTLDFCGARLKRIPLFATGDGARFGIIRFSLLRLYCDLQDYARALSDIPPVPQANFEVFRPPPQSIRQRWAPGDTVSKVSVGILRFRGRQTQR